MEMYMIIEIEAYFGDYYLFGGSMSFLELEKRTSHILNKVTECDFVSIFCARYHFEQLDSYHGFVDYVIDLDTHKVYKPHL